MIKANGIFIKLGTEAIPTIANNDIHFKSSPHNLTTNILVYPVYIRYHLQHITPNTIYNIHIPLYIQYILLYEHTKPTFGKTLIPSPTLQLDYHGAPRLNDSARPIKTWRVVTRIVINSEDIFYNDNGCHPIRGHISRFMGFGHKPRSCIVAVLNGTVLLSVAR